jgi:hypothetical protein
MIDFGRADLHHRVMHAHRGLLKARKPELEGPRIFCVR